MSEEKESKQRRFITIGERVYRIFSDLEQALTAAKSLAKDNRRHVDVNDFDTRKFFGAFDGALPALTGCAPRDRATKKCNEACK